MVAVTAAASAWRHLPNLICIARILLLAPIIALLLADRALAALLLIALASASDVLDGFLAKRFGWRSRLGGLLDPLADKALLVGLFLTLTGMGLLPFWLAVVVVVRDLVIVAGAVAYHVLIAPLYGNPSLVGKLNTACQSAYVLLIIATEAFDWAADAWVTGAGAVVFTIAVISGGHYVLAWTLLAIRYNKTTS